MTENAAAKSDREIGRMALADTLEGVGEVWGVEDPQSGCPEEGGT